MIKRLWSISLAVLFLISGIGFHIDLEYCCGNLEKLGLFDHLSIEIEDCCPEERRSMHDCMESDHVVKAIESQDLQSIGQLSLQKVATNQVQITFPTAIQWTGNNYYTLRVDQLHPPPIIILQQQFLC